MADSRSLVGVSRTARFFSCATGSASECGNISEKMLALLPRRGNAQTHCATRPMQPVTMEHTTHRSCAVSSLLVSAAASRTPFACHALCRTGPTKRRSSRAALPGWAWPWPVKLASPRAPAWCMAARDRERLAAAVEQVARRGARSSRHFGRYHPARTTSTGSLRKSLDEFHRLDILVNCAGRSSRGLRARHNALPNFTELLGD